MSPGASRDRNRLLLNGVPIEVVVRPAVTFVAVNALAFALIASAQAAAPRLIMVSDEPLGEPVVTADARVVFALYGSLFHDGATVDGSQLKGRRALRLGLFWHNPTWEPYVRDGRLAELRLHQANQVGRFYPAVGDEAALVVLPGYGSWPKRVSKEALQILEANGIPVRLDNDDGSRWLAAGVAGGGLATIPLLLLALRWRRSRLSGAEPAGTR
jgi:hypothetical protein